MPFTVLVCGGRDFADEKWVHLELDVIHRGRKITRLVHGNAEGADKLAATWGFKNHVLVVSYPADWNNLDMPGAVLRRGPGGNLYNAAAGPIRNREMLEAEKPDLVLAFPGGTGTKDMIEKANKRGFKVLEV